MITHVVLFRLLDASPEHTAAVRDQYYEALARVASIDSVEVHVNARENRFAHDLAVIMRFSTWERREAYVADPFHREAGDMIGALSCGIAAIDYVT